MSLMVSNILTYVRRIIKSPSDQAIPDSLILDYVNRFYTYDMPERIQLFELKTKFNLETVALVDQYNMPVNSDGNLTYQNLMMPVFCDGVQISLFHSRSQFFNLFPLILQNEDNLPGDGGSTYSFSVSNSPISRGHIDLLGNLNPGVYISAFTQNNTRLVVTDSGQFDASNQNLGTLTGDGTGTVNYQTGVVSVTFSSPIPATTTGSTDQNMIETQTYQFTPGRPIQVLFFNNIVTLRPIPDKTYLLEFDAYLTPAAFLNSNESIQYSYMAEYIGRGAARKILADNGDVEQLQLYEPFFREQENLVLRKTDRIRSQMRTPTIFSQSGYPYPFTYPYVQQP